MVKRPLAILSEGRITEAQSTALTLLSLGWIEIGLAQSEIEEIRRNNKLRVIYMGPEQEKPLDRQYKRQLADDQEVLAIIHTFIEWQALEVV